MGLFTPAEADEGMYVRQTGFNRYKQLLDFHAGTWFRVGLLTVAGIFPLVTGILFSITTSSVLALLHPGRPVLRALPVRTLRRHPPWPAGRPQQLVVQL